MASLASAICSSQTAAGQSPKHPVTSWARIAHHLALIIGVGPQKYFLKFVQERQKKRPVFEAVEGKNGAEYGVAGDGCSKILKSARISDLFWLRLLLLSSNLRPFSPKMKTNLTSF